MQTTIGSLLNTPPASSSEAVGSAPSDASAAFSAVYAREMQHSGMSDDSTTPVSLDIKAQSNQGPLPLIAVEENPSDAAFLAEVWAILEEVAPLQEVAGTTGEHLPDELTSQLVDAAFELGRLADELSSALVQKPILDARGLDPAVIAAGLGGRPGVIGVAETNSGLTDVAKSLAAQSFATSSLSAALPVPAMGSDSVEGLTASTTISQAINEVINRLRSLMDAAGRNDVLEAGSDVTRPSTSPATSTLISPLTAQFGSSSMFADLPVPALELKQNVSGSLLAPQRALSSGLDLLRTLSTAPTAITALPAAPAGQLDALQSSSSASALPVGADLNQLLGGVLSASPAELVRQSLGNDKSLRSLSQNLTLNDVADIDALLDEGFRIQDPGTAFMREANALAASAGSTLDNLIRSGSPTETRQPDSATNPAPQSNADKTTVLAEQRATVATAKSDVWLRSTDELPDHILAHVGRMHAQSLRFNAAGIGDLVQRMTLSLHPEELGQVDVQMRSGEQMSLVFYAREGATRDLLEHNLARLRQLFESQGISLGDISVGTGGASDRQARDDTSNALLDQFSQGGMGAGLDRPSGPRPSVASDRLIDTRA